MAIYIIGNDPLLDYDEVKTATYKEAVEYLVQQEELGLDIETTRKFGGKYKEEGLDPYLSEIVMLQLGDKENQYIFDWRVLSVVQRVHLSERIMANPNIKKVGHNLKFEYKHIKLCTGVELNNLFDTMIADQVIYCGFDYRSSLKLVVRRELGVELEKETRLEFLSIGSTPFSQRQVQYGADDIVYPLLVKEKQLRLIEQRELQNCIRLENQFIIPLAQIELNGMHFNAQHWEDVYTVNRANMAVSLDKLNELVINNPDTQKFVKKQLNLFSIKKECGVKWTSPKEVMKLLTHLEMCPEEMNPRTGTMTPTVNSKALKNQMYDKASSFGKLFIDCYCEYKELQKLCTTYGKDFFKYINPVTERIHSNYRQILSTGRISSSNPNLQNIPTGILRKAFDAPSDTLIVNADYSGQEQIILANKSNETKLIDFYLAGESDMHSYIARELFPSLTGMNLNDIKKEHPQKRQIAKAAGFAINYGGDGSTIAKNLGVSSSIGRQVYDNYFASFPDLHRYFRKVFNMSLSKGYILIDNLTKRKYFFANSFRNTNDSDKFSTSKPASKIKKLSMNYPIQGEAGSITKLAAVIFHNRIKKLKLDHAIGITNLVHDEINVECHDKLMIIGVNELEDAMEKAANTWCKAVNMKANAVVGHYWNH